MSMKKITTPLVLITLLLTLSGCQPTPNTRTTPPTPTKTPKAITPVTGMTEAEAQKIAETTCIKGGESLTPGSYNENSKTWWFDANLNATKPGCTPACVVSEETKTAEINWRCTGLIPPVVEPIDNSVSEVIRQLLAKKYPKYAKTISINPELWDENHVRGLASFEAGAPGGIFFALKKDDNWKIVHDGNGQIPCTLSDDGFSAEMLSDCAQPQ